jgi:hypothetical protein
MKLETWQALLSLNDRMAKMLRAYREDDLRTAARQAYDLIRDAASLHEKLTGEEEAARASKEAPGSSVGPVETAPR